MSDKITIRSAKYFKPFDNTDNPCCWQVGLISEDVDVILDHQNISYDSISEDWGTAYSWKDNDGIDHSMLITCTDVDHAEYQFEYFAIKIRLMGLLKKDVTSSSDFRRIIPELLKLNRQ
jgi:hypothetical protein